MGSLFVGGPTMLTAMTEADWVIVLRVFAASRSRRGDKGLDDRKFLEALHYFVVHSITWRALPEKFGHWNSVWKRFWQLSRSGTFEAFFDALAVKPVIAATLRRFSTSALISIRAPHSVTKATIPNQTATPRANAEYVRQSRIDPTPRICPPSFRKHSTRRGQDRKS